MAEPTFLGAVLSGGESRRMGRDKAALTAGGVGMLERAVSALDPYCAEVVVVSARPGTPSAGRRVLSDERPGCGPLAGLEAALGDADRGGHDAVVALAVDLPLVGHEDVRVLLDAWRDGGRSDAVAASRPDGDPPFEPLCAVYPCAALATATRLLDGGERAARALFSALGGRVVEDVGGADVNVNTPGDLRSAEERLT